MSSLEIKKSPKHFMLRFRSILKLSKYLILFKQLNCCLQCTCILNTCICLVHKHIISIFIKKWTPVLSLIPTKVHVMPIRICTVPNKISKLFLPKCRNLSYAYSVMSNITAAVFLKCSICVLISSL